MKSIAWVIVLMLLCGLGDALGFIYAGKIWQEGHFTWTHALKSALGFQFGVLMYLLALRDLNHWGVVAAETQTLVCLAVTICAVAVMSGQLWKWHVSDQLVAACVLCGVGWLACRTGA
jgi:peptidoglycan/LPS O-acetylase OafA/YrhL